uniref:Uncharacterized protein n=1 Tax=Alexandrium monilatum TaxID=311494 RepID=A0A7S4T2S3_9DINO
MAALLLPGVVVGYALMFVFLSACSRFYIFTRQSWNAMFEASPEAPAIRPPPEAYLRFSTHSFVSMIATGAIIVTAFGGVDWNATPFMREYGMNTLGFFFNLSPATYVMPSYWFVTAFSTLRYCVLDTERLLRQPTSAWCKHFGIVTNGIFAGVTIIFSMVWSVRIDDDAISYELPFLMYVMCIPLVYVMHLWETSFTRRTTCLAITTLSIYVHVAVLYAISLAALRYKKIVPEYAKPLQWLWVGFSAVCPLATYPGTPVKPEVRRGSSRTSTAERNPAEPHAPRELAKAQAVQPIKIQVQPARLLMSEPSESTRASHSTATTPESMDKSQEPRSASRTPAEFQSDAQPPGAPLRFAMGISSDEATFQPPYQSTMEAAAQWQSESPGFDKAHPASSSLAEARALGSSRSTPEANGPSSHSPQSQLQAGSVSSGRLPSQANGSSSHSPQSQLQAGSVSSGRLPLQANAFPAPTPLQAHAPSSSRTLSQANAFPAPTPLQAHAPSSSRTLSQAARGRSPGAEEADEEAPPPPPPPLTSAANLGLGSDWLEVIAGAVDREKAAGRSSEVIASSVDRERAPGRFSEVVASAVDHERAGGGTSEDVSARKGLNSEKTGESYIEEV